MLNSHENERVETSDRSARAQAFEFLAGIFLKEPTREIFNELQAWAESSGEQEAIELLRKIVQNDPDLTGLVQEYYDLFFVPVSGRFVPPFESAIRDAWRYEEKKTRFGSLWGKATTEVASFYERIEFHPESLAAFEPLRHLNLPDHIGFELSFMSYLYHHEAEELKQSLTTKRVRRLEQEFLQNHLEHWIPLLVHDLSLIDQSGFYLYFAMLARDFCLEERIELTSHLFSETDAVQSEFPTQNLIPKHLTSNIAKSDPKHYSI